MNTPTPGTPVRGSKSGQPIMALLDLLGRKTCLRILWELRAGPLKFRQLQAAAETSPGVLNTRLAELKAAGIVETTAEGYRVTPRGEQLAGHLIPLSKWAQEWAAELPEMPTGRTNK